MCLFERASWLGFGEFYMNNFTDFSIKWVLVGQRGKFYALWQQSAFYACVISVPYVDRQSTSPGVDIIWLSFHFLCPPAPITYVEAIEGQQAHLYCPMTIPTADKINMVLWFKDDVGVPIYRWVSANKKILKGNVMTFYGFSSFDVRGKALKDATTWSDPSVFGTRAKFNLERDLTMDPAFLEIDVS